MSESGDEAWRCGAGTPPAWDRSRHERRVGSGGAMLACPRHGLAGASEHVLFWGAPAQQQEAQAGDVGDRLHPAQPGGKPAREARRRPKSGQSNTGQPGGSGSRPDRWKSEQAGSWSRPTWSRLAQVGCCPHFIYFFYLACLFLLSIDLCIASLTWNIANSGGTRDYPLDITPVET